MRFSTSVNESGGSRSLRNHARLGSGIRVTYCVPFRFINIVLLLPFHNVVLTKHVDVWYSRRVYLSFQIRPAWKNRRYWPTDTITRPRTSDTCSTCSNSTTTTIIRQPHTPSWTRPVCRTPPCRGPTHSYSKAKDCPWKRWPGECTLHARLTCTPAAFRQL